MDDVVFKRNRIFCRLSTMHERDRQTDRPRNGNIDRSRRPRLPAMSPNKRNPKLLSSLRLRDYYTCVIAVTVLTK